MTLIMETRDLQHDFGGMAVIRGVDLQIREGERHAIIGPNGAGKTTLFNLLSGFYKPSRGRILFKGRDVTGLKPHQFNRLGLGRSFQITNTFSNQTVFENLRLGALARRGIRYNGFKGVSKMSVVTAEAAELIERIDLNLHRNIRASMLDYGKSRALEVSLAMTTDPDLVLLDEPCAGMSREETKKAVSMIRELTAGKSMVIVEHDMDVVFSLADRITVLHYGRILATGDPAEIRNNPSVKDAYLGNETSL